MHVNKYSDSSNVSWGLTAFCEARIPLSPVAAYLSHASHMQLHRECDQQQPGYAITQPRYEPVDTPPPSTPSEPAQNPLGLSA